MNVHTFVDDGTLYIGADFYFPFKRWVHSVAKNDRVRVRARGLLYPLRAVRIDDPAELIALQSQLERRLALWRGLDPETTPGFQTEMWLYRMEAR